MKRIVAMILSGMMMLVLAACSGNGTQGKRSAGIRFGQ